MKTIFAKNCLRRTNFISGAGASHLFHSLVSNVTQKKPVESSFVSLLISNTSYIPSMKTLPLIVCLFLFPFGLKAGLPNLIEEEDRTQLFESLSRLSSQRDHHKVMWWNIEWGQHGEDLETKEGRNPLVENFERLFKSGLAPDVLILGEYAEEHLPTRFYNLMINHYPHINVYDYNENYQTTGIAIFSRIPFTKQVERVLNWTSFSADKRDREFALYRKHCPKHLLWKRRYLLLEFRPQGYRPFYITPVHINQPWECIQKLQNTASLGLEIFMGEDNPLATQIYRLKTMLKADIRKDKRRQNIMVVGDFNVPPALHSFSDYANMQTVGYRYMTSILKDAFYGSRRYQSTFPTPSSQESYPGMKLDHAFIGKKARVKRAEILPLKGSDHYPLYMILAK
jgi:endonuclease/exonuclease/phosphatase family metal-dependent hydrolase